MNQTENRSSALTSNPSYNEHKGIESLIPRPASLNRHDGVFVICPETALVCDENSESAARALNDAMLRVRGFALGSTPVPGRPTVTISINAGDPPHGNEGYRLDVTPARITITASHPAGAFYAVQTLLQLLPAEIFSSCRVDGIEWRVPCVEIEDLPRFAWRGLMLDTARHFFTVSEIKRFLDQMVLHKFNVFHWHLVDDQGWRLEIRKYPRLTEVGSHRAESPAHVEMQGKEGDGMPYHGHYTQDEVRELVRYAQERFVTIVPEIEMPGHAAAAITAYPWLGNEDIPDFRPNVATSWGMKLFTFSPKEETFHFLENVLLEVMELFPSQRIHIGGDEAAKDQWKQSPSAQLIMKEHGLADEEHLQSWFLSRIQTFLHRHGRTMIGWDEIQEGGLAPGAAMMVWRNSKWAKVALEAGNDVVMSPVSHCYFDHYQGPAESEPKALGDYLPLEKVYELDPMTEASSAATGNVLGVQGNLWTEAIPDVNLLDYMAYPRACALAEVAWSPAASRNWEDFNRRLSVHKSRLDLMGVSYRPLSSCPPWK